MVAIVESVSDQVPPDIESKKTVVVPAQREENPEIAAGRALMVIIMEVEQPVPRVYEMVSVPGNRAVKNPSESIEALVFEADHVPPANESVREVEEPAQRVVAPEIPEGFGFTEIANEAEQPVGKTYQTVSIPDVIEVSDPEASMFAIVESVSDQVPPVTESK